MRLSLALNLALGLLLVGHAYRQPEKRQSLVVTVGTGCPTADGMMIGTGFGLPCKEINLHTVEIVK